MKSYTLVCLLVVFGLSSALPSSENIEDQIHAYVQSKISSVIRKPSLGRSGGGLACYDKYIPLINSATANSKTEIQNCNNLATTRREDELNKVKEQRQALDDQVISLQNTLSACSKQEDTLGFLTCLKDNSQLLQSVMEQVTTSSSSLSTGLTGAYATIDNSENLCIQQAFDKIKSDTDSLTAAMQSCLMNGFDQPQPESSTEAPASSSTTESSSSSTTTESVPESSTSEEPSSEASSSTEADPSSSTSEEPSSEASSTTEADSSSSASEEPSSETSSTTEADSSSSASEEPSSESSSSTETVPSPSTEAPSSESSESSSEGGRIDYDLLPEEQL